MFDTFIDVVGDEASAAGETQPINKFPISGAKKRVTTGREK